MVAAQDIEATAMGQARTRDARPAGLKSSSVALAGPQHFAIWCRSIPSEHWTRRDALIDPIACAPQKFHPHPLDVASSSSDNNQEPQVFIKVAPTVYDILEATIRAAIEFTEADAGHIFLIKRLDDQVLVSHQCLLTHTGTIIRQYEQDRCALQNLSSSLPSANIVAWDLLQWDRGCMIISHHSSIVAWLFSG
jgi:hypothetical protein